MSTGEMFRQAISADTPVGRQALLYISQGKLVPDRLTEEMVGERLAKPDCDRGCLFDGFPRTLSQARSITISSFTARHSMSPSSSWSITKSSPAACWPGPKSNTGPTTRRKPFPIALPCTREQTTPLLEYYRNQEKLASVDGMGKRRRSVRRRISACLEPLKK